jgi:hypothetical protein
MGEDGGDEAPPLPNARPLASSSMVDRAADGSTDHGPRASGSRSHENNNEVRKLLYNFSFLPQKLNSFCADGFR